MEEKLVNEKQLKEKQENEKLENKTDERMETQSLQNTEIGIPSDTNHTSDIGGLVTSVSN